MTRFWWADVAQLVEHSLGKGEVISSILIIGSMVFGLGTSFGFEGLGRARLQPCRLEAESRAALAAEGFTES
jgi:hypothetical protein